MEPAVDAVVALLAVPHTQANVLALPALPAELAVLPPATTPSDSSDRATFGSGGKAR